MIDETPMIWMAKIEKSDGCRPGGQARIIVQPPEKASRRTGEHVEISSRTGRQQHLQLLRRGKAMSEAPIMCTTCQLKPTSDGMIAPKIMISPCMVVSWLNTAGWNSCRPGWNSSARISIASAPAKNMNSENHR